ncbi:MAG: MarR family transcriptional regulator [Methylobacteriaceae bacterium]|nr:MarR family transcriptional regulator [Methylobacteriaceae bacterium]
MRDQPTGPRRLDADAARVWFRLLRLESRINTALASRLRALGLTAPQCDVLTTLTEREGVSQQELAERLYVTKGNISGLIDRLVASGLVERRTLAEDRRSHAIYLSSAGRRRAQEAIAMQREFVAQTFGQLPPEKLIAFEELLILTRDLVRAQSSEREGRDQGEETGALAASSA